MRRPTLTQQTPKYISIKQSIEMRLQVLWHATKAKNNHFWTALTFEDEDTRPLRNVGYDSPDNIAAHKAVKSQKL